MSLAKRFFSTSIASPSSKPWIELLEIIVRFINENHCFSVTRLQERQVRSAMVKLDHQGQRPTQSPKHQLQAINRDIKGIEELRIEKSY